MAGHENHLVGVNSMFMQHRYLCFAPKNVNNANNFMV